MLKVKAFNDLKVHLQASMTELEARCSTDDDRPRKECLRFSNPQQPCNTAGLKDKSSVQPRFILSCLSLREEAFYIHTRLVRVYLTRGAASIKWLIELILYIIYFD